MAANGRSVKSFAAALREGRSGVRTITRFDTGWPFRQGAAVDLEEPEPGLDRVSQLALAAARLAAEDSGLARGEPEAARTGLCLGTSRGPALSLETLLRSGEATERPALLEEMPFHSVARNVAWRLGLGDLCPR
jgi:3-oxoacyl-(acyl-carrier-protein) synthase